VLRNLSWLAWRSFFIFLACVILLLFMGEMTACITLSLTYNQNTANSLAALGISWTFLVSSGFLR